MNWLQAVDLDHATRNCRTDIFGDWHRDPWDWPELEWLKSAAGQPFVVERLNARKPRGAVHLDVPKPNFGRRPVVVLDIVERLAYQAVVDRLSTLLLADVPTWMYGWRLSRSNPQSGVYNKQAYEWDLYLGHLKVLANNFDAALTTDITSYFASIPLDQLAESVEQRGGGSAVSKRVVRYLLGWDPTLGYRGLPQRCHASAVLANLHLRPVDDLLTANGVVSGPLRARIAPHTAAATRWVDDIWLFSDERSTLRHIQVKIQREFEGIGLTMNSAKTVVHEGEALIEAVAKMEHSGIDAALNVAGNRAPLKELAELVLHDPENASTTDLNFISSRLTGQRNVKRLADRLRGVAERMPHGAYALARLFYHTTDMSRLEAWYTNYANSHWAVFDWTLAQYALMFQPGWRPSCSSHRPC